MFRINFMIIVLAFALSACTTSSSLTAPTAFPTPQPTVSPTETPAPLPTPPATQQTIDATQQATAELASAFPGLCDTGSLLISPDDNWLAKNCSFNNFQILKRGRGVMWNITYDEISGNNDPYNHGSVSPVHWANDSQYLYFAAEDCCWDPFFILLADTRNLYKFDINTGEHNLIRDGLFDVSFSPTDKRMTFIEELDTPPTVEIHNPQTGTSDTVTLNVDDKHNQAKVDVWSSDESRFAVTTVSGINYSHDVFTPDRFSLIVIDTNDLSQKLVVKDMQTSYLQALEWTKNDVLIFQTGDEFLGGPVAIWQYNLKTDTLSTPTPTP